MCALFLISSGTKIVGVLSNSIGTATLKFRLSSHLKMLLSMNKITNFGKFSIFNFFYLLKFNNKVEKHTSTSIKIQSDKSIGSVVSRRTSQSVQTSYLSVIWWLTTWRDREVTKNGPCFFERDKLAEIEKSSSFPSLDGIWRAASRKFLCFHTTVSPKRNNLG